MVNHQPVLLTETLRALDLHPGSRIIDGTLGDGGHAEAILERTGPNGKLLGMDADPKALETAAHRLQRFETRVRLVHANFREVKNIAEQQDFIPSHAILLDLGLRSTALTGTARGLSFQRDEPLDMRFDPRSERTAAELVNTLSRDELKELISRYGQDRFAANIADGIVVARRRTHIETTKELVAILDQSIPRAAHRGKIHFATKTFQALRIAVNDELGALQQALLDSNEVLEPHGRLVIISYHSLEDRMVKKFLKQSKNFEPAVRGVVVPSKEEIRLNPRARSAKMRVLQKTNTKYV